jgi:hypothetical protein
MAVPPLAAGTSADDEEMRDYRLTMDKLRKFVAVGTALQADSKRNSAAAPGAVARVKEAGMAPREVRVMTAVL